MIDETYFNGSGDVKLIPYRFTEQQVSEATSSVPNWVPRQYIQFFRRFGDFIAPGFVMFSPLYDPAEFYYIKTGNQKFREELGVLGYPADEWFAFGHYDGSSYAVFHLVNGGECECGSYDFTDQAYFRGPFESFDDWLKSHSAHQ